MLNAVSSNSVRSNVIQPKAITPKGSLGRKCFIVLIGREAEWVVKYLDKVFFHYLKCYNIRCEIYQGEKTKINVLAM